MTRQQSKLEQELSQPGHPTNRRTKWIVAALLVGAVITIVAAAGTRWFDSPVGKQAKEPQPQTEPNGIADVQAGAVAKEPELAKEPDSRAAAGLATAPLASTGGFPTDFGKGSTEPELAKAPDGARLPSGSRSDWTRIDDPAKDGWDTEQFHDKAKKQLAALGKLLTHPGEIDATRAAELVTDDFVCGPLVPGDLITVAEDQVLKVERLSNRTLLPPPLEQSSADQRSSQAGPRYRGAEGLVEALHAVAASLSGANDVRFEFKVFRVVSSPAEVSTRQFFAISGRTKTGSVEQHATWVVRWAPGAGGVLPRIRSIQVEEFERTTSRQPSGAFFADCTESVLGRNATYADQFLRGMNYWFERIQDPRYFALLGNPGIAIGDVNGDGLDDLYVCQEAGLPNRLFVQNRDGTARDESESWGVNWLDSSRSALLVDLDNDSDQDLVVAILGGVVVAENDGQKRFLLRDVLATRADTMSLSAVDYDMDGRLDIYVCVYNQNQGLESTDSVALPGAAVGFVLHDANNGGRNSLLRNQISADGTWRFTDVTRDVGLDVNNQRWSFAAAWDDFDNDGDQDLYVANDYGRDNLYRNDPPSSPLNKVRQKGVRRFVDISDTARIEDSATGMSITCGDYDRDGWIDVFVSNMYSSAGNRIAFQSTFKPEAPREAKRRLQRMARGNTLLRNLGDGTFDNVSAPAGIEMGRWAWGSHFVDVNNDGWEDMIVSNGYITTEDTGDL